MLFEYWRWKPRLVWLLMHAAALGLLWCSGAWPAQAQYSALLATTAALYVSTSFVDPGYIELASSSAPALDRASLSALAVPLMLQACDMCGVAKPTRAKHCYDCGRCVRRMDHHCWWLGNCVGERTHRRFLYFLGAQAALLWWSCGAAACSVVSCP